MDAKKPSVNGSSDGECHSDLHKMFDGRVDDSVTKGTKAKEILEVRSDRSALHARQTPLFAPQTRSIVMRRT